MKKGDKVKDLKTGEVATIVDVRGGLIYVMPDSASHFATPECWYYKWVKKLEGAGE